MKKSMLESYFWHAFFVMKIKICLDACFRAIVVESGVNFYYNGRWLLLLMGLLTPYSKKKGL